MREPGLWFPRHNDVMKNRTVGFLLALLACVPLLIFHATGDTLLKDSDTNFLIFKLNEYNNPWRWFINDWPLENHFYRPISTLFFEYDNRMHPGNNGAFGLTNALICSLAVLALYWFLCEVKRSIPVALVGTYLFASWTLGGWFLGSGYQTIVSILPWIALVAILGRMIAAKKWNWASLIVGLGGFYVWNQLICQQSYMAQHTMYWLPGRTATSMAIFALVALASYMRFERLGAPMSAALEVSATDLPATRSSSQNSEPKNVWGWFVLSLLSTAIALGAYEQAVMIPAMIFILGVWLRVNRQQTRFSFQILFWAVLVAYIVYRVQIIPVQPSGYQKQQFRNGPGLWIDIFNYILPGVFGIYASFNALSSGALVLMTESFWPPLASFFTNVSAWVSLGKKAIWKPAIALSLALFAYLPMAFLKQFGHYHFFPAAMMTLFVISLFEAYWPKLVRAVSPSALQAPKRVERAPGSLPKF